MHQLRDSECACVPIHGHTVSYMSYLHTTMFLVVAMRSDFCVGASVSAAPAVGRAAALRFVAAEASMAAGVLMERFVIVFSDFISRRESGPRGRGLGPWHKNS